MADEAQRFSDRIFDGYRASSELEMALEEIGVPFERLGFDWYDESIEIRDVSPEYRLTPEVQRLLYDAGFAKVFVNHTDKWETHYSFSQKKPFEESKGWRVSYPHKRDDKDGPVWVEEVVPTWPPEWFETGYCVIKSPE